MRRKVRFFALLLLVWNGSWGCSNEDHASGILVTDVDHSKVKRQAIGNCWLYAHATWLESLMLTASQEELDVSESYWTWWHWYHQVVGNSIDQIQTGGWWGISTRIIQEHGWVLEEEFIPGDKDRQMSVRQSQALAHMNRQLREGGALANPRDRTASRVRAELDRAFGTDMAAAEEMARSPDDTIVSRDEDGDIVTLRDALSGSSRYRWQQIAYPRVYGQNSRPTRWQVRQRQQLLRRALTAINDYHPVVFSLMIDFNALDIEDQTFKASKLRDVGTLGTQGGHMLVLEDYAVTNAPGYGDIGEGDVSDEMKAAALDGDVVHLKAKNSWGTDRPDRGLTDGYTRFDWEYLNSQLEWKYGDAGETSFYTTLMDFVLPPGY